MGFADIDQLKTGAKKLAQSGTAVNDMERPMSTQFGKIASSVGDASLATAVHRLSAGWSTSIGDTGSQLHAAALLAQNFSLDMACATGPTFDALQTFPPWSKFSKVTSDAPGSAQGHGAP